MLDLIGWYKTTSTAWDLREYITQDAVDLSKYTLEDASGPWVPQAGDVFTDSAGLEDTVMAVEDSTTFYGVVGGAGWSDGFATVVRKSTNVRAHTVNFRGRATARDNQLLDATDLALASGNAVAATLTANAAPFAPDGWAYADVVEVTPDADLWEIRAAHWHAPQGVKLLINTSDSYTFVVVHNRVAYAIAEGRIFTSTAGDLLVGPGDAVAFVRDANEDNWRAAVTSSTLYGATGGSGAWMVDAQHRVLGAAPDTGSQSNQWNNPATFGKISQGTASQRPHWSGSGVNQILSYDRSASQMLENRAIGTLVADTSYVAMFIVARFDSLASNQVLVDMSSNAGAAGSIQGLTIGYDTATTDIRGRALTAEATITGSSSGTFSDTASFHLFEAVLTSAGVTVGVDGTFGTLGPFANTGVSGDQTAIAAGYRLDSARHFDGDMKFACVLADPTAGQTTATRVAIAAKYGITLP